MGYKPVNFSKPLEIFCHDYNAYYPVDKIQSDRYGRTYLVFRDKTGVIRETNLKTAILRNKKYEYVTIHGVKRCVFVDKPSKKVEKVEQINASIVPPSYNGFEPNKILMDEFPNYNSWVKDTLFGRDYYYKTIYNVPLSVIENNSYAKPSEISKIFKAGYNLRYGQDTVIKVTFDGDTFSFTHTGCRFPLFILSSKCIVGDNHFHIVGGDIKQVIKEYNKNPVLWNIYIRLREVLSEDDETIGKLHIKSGFKYPTIEVNCGTPIEPRWIEKSLYVVARDCTKENVKRLFKEIYD